MDDMAAESVAEEPTPGSSAAGGENAAEFEAAEERVFLRLQSAHDESAARTIYGTRPDQFVEWFGDVESARAVVILIHGGYFRQRYPLNYMRPMALSLVGDGFGRGEAARGRAGAHRAHDVAVALVEYRRVESVPAADQRAGALHGDAAATGRGEGGHPRTIEDIEAAIAHVVSVCRDARGATAEDLTWVVSGHSAGGSLALSWASRQPVDGPRVRVRPLAGVTDLVAEVRDGLSDGAVEAYMGATPETDLQRFLEEDPRSRAVLIPSRIDLELVHGTCDQTVSVDFARGFPAARLEIDGAHHFDVVDPDSPHFAAVVDSLFG